MNMILKTLAVKLTTSLTTSLALCGAAQAVIVNIDAAVTGCQNSSNCDGSPHLLPGAYVGPLINPAQLTLAAGTYTITNGAGLAGANPNFTAWRFNGGDNWVWAFEVIDDATKTMLVQGCCGDIVNNQAGAANQTFAQNYSSTLTLLATTTLDFITEDYYPYDNAGGIALKITSSTAPVPEPTTWALMFAGLCGLGMAARKRSACNPQG